MCGRYYIAPDEEDEDWEEIIAILQRRGEDGENRRNFPIGYGTRHCQQPQHASHALCHALGVFASQW